MSSLRSLTFGDAVAAFERKNLACMIPDGRTGQLRSMSDTRVAAVLSAVRAGLERATGRTGKQLLDVTLRPYVAALPRLAHDEATVRTASRPSNYASDVRTFLRVVEGVDPHKRGYKRQVTADAFAGDWRVLGEALLNGEVEGDRFRRYAGWLEQLQVVCMVNGIREPGHVPDDYETVKEWCEQERIKEKHRGDLFTAWRKARELSGWSQLAALEPPSRPSHRGIQALPHLQNLLVTTCARLNDKRAVRAASRGQPGPDPLRVGDGRGMTPIELLEFLTPEMAKAVKLYLAHASTEELKSESWRTTVVAATSGIVAELYRLPPTRRTEDGPDVQEDPFSLDLRHLFTERRLVRATAIAAAEELDLDALDEVAGVAYDSVPLIRLLVDAAAVRSYTASCLQVPTEQEKTDVPLYTPAVFNDVLAIWAVVSHVFGDRLGWKAKKEREWRIIERTYEDLLAHMQKHNQTRETTGYKNKTLLTINWGQAVCIGLPLLRKCALDLRAIWLDKELAYALASTPEGPIDLEARLAARMHRPVNEARQRYLTALREWVQVGVILDDMMRIKNYARGTMGQNFIPEFLTDKAQKPVLDDLGRPRIASMTVTFRGFDRVAGTKRKRKRGSGAERIRTRTLSPGIVDNLLLADYLFELRVDDLIRIGKIASHRDYSLAQDRWAFFTHPGSKRESGGYSEARLSKRFGRVIHWMHRDVLALRDAERETLPEWRDLMAPTAEGKELRRKYRALFGGHFNRQLGVTYLIGVLQDHVEAAHRTNDTRQVLDDFYAEFANAIAEARKTAGIRNPDWFKEVVAQLLRGHVIDWDSFDPQQPAQRRILDDSAPGGAPYARPRGRRPPRPPVRSRAAAAPG